jgi:hypothetical protein
VFEGVCSFKWMDDVQLAVSVDTGFALPVTAEAAPSGAQQTTTLECCDALNLSVAETGHQEMHFTNVAQAASVAAAKPFSPAPPPPAPPPPPSSMLLPSTPSAPLKSPSLKSPPLMSSPAFATALQSVVLNKTPKPNPASARSAASPSMSKGDDLMAALVARISARRRRMTNTVVVDDAASKAHDGLHAASDWSDASPADSDGEFSRCPSPKRLAAQIVKSIPWSNGRTRVDPLSAPSSSLSGVNESDVDGGVDCNGRHSRSATPMLFEKALDLSGMDGLDRVNCSGISVSSSSSSASSKTLCIGSLLQPEPFALNDNITSRRGSRGYHVN